MYCNYNQNLTKIKLSQNSLKAFLNIHTYTKKPQFCSKIVKEGFKKEK